MFWTQNGLWGADRALASPGAQDWGPEAGMVSDSPSLGTSPSRARSRPALGCSKQENPREAGGPEREERAGSKGLTKCLK